MFRAVHHWLGVNGGVFLCAYASHEAARLATSAGGSDVAGAVVGTAILYVLVFTACHLNLRGRQRTLRTTSAAPPISVSSVLAHPIGSVCERLLHGRYLARAATAVVFSGSGSGSSSSDDSFSSIGLAWWLLWLAARLLIFELTFDALFYVAHRAVHAHPLVYAKVHKLHHRHTSHLWLLSSLQMTAADVLITHTLPVLGALAIVPLAPGLELSVVKTYLLFQELYGHAGVEHKGRNFGPAPWLAMWLNIELRAEDHQRHHIQASCNCMRHQVSNASSARMRIQHQCISFTLSGPLLPFSQFRSASPCSTNSAALLLRMHRLRCEPNRCLPARSTRRSVRAEGMCARGAQELWARKAQEPSSLQNSTAIPIAVPVPIRVPSW